MTGKAAFCFREFQCRRCSVSTLVYFTTACQPPTAWADGLYEPRDVLRVKNDNNYIMIYCRLGMKITPILIVIFKFPRNHILLPRVKK